MTKRVEEKELAIPALKEMSQSSSGKIRVAALIKKLEDKYLQDGEDAKILDKRSDTKFSQKVRNLVSHRDTSTSIFKRGFAEYSANDQSVSITEHGREFLKKIKD